ncbi:hypothetical protein ABIA22_005734 [Sinorhizobium fredii]
MHRFQTRQEHRHEPAGVAKALRGDIQCSPAADRKRVAAIQPAGQRTLRRIDRLTQILCGPRTERRLAHARLRKENAVLAAKHGRPRTAGAEDGLCPDGTLFGNDPRHRAIDQIEASRSAPLVDRCPESASAIRDRRRGNGGFALAVIDRMHSAQPSAAVRRNCVSRFLGAQHPGIDVERASHVTPCFPFRQLPRIIGSVEQAASAETDVLSDLRRKRIPNLQSDAREWQLALIPVLPAAPAPVAARLLASDMALFDQGDRQSPLREKECRRCTNNAAADDDDIRLGGKLLIVLDALDNWRHGG